jgi:twinkle protein
MATWEELGIDTRGKTSGKHKVKCPKCCGEGKRDTDLSIDVENGLYKCHKPTCEWHIGGKVNMGYTPVIAKKERAYSLPKFNNNTELSDGAVKWFQGRGISQGTLLKMMITEGKEWMPQANKERNTIQFNYFRDGQLINVKYRDGQKNFKLAKDAELILYNLDGIKGRKTALICEGEMDCLSFIEAGVDFAMSVPNGASKGKSNLEYLNNCFEQLDVDKLDKIYIAVDNDEAGSNLRDELARRLGKDRCSIVEYPEGCKDANDVLVHYGTEELLSCLSRAKDIPIEDIYRVDDVRELMRHEFINGKVRGTTTYFGSIDPHWTWKKKEVTLTYGVMNSGKTEIMLELMLLKSVNEGTKWAIYSPENYPPGEFFDNLIHKLVGKTTDPYWKEYQMSLEEYDKGMDFINEHFFYVYPEEAPATPDHINEKFRQLIFKYGVEGCLIDPVNQLDHDLSKHGREDLYISDFLRKEKMFANKYDVYKLIIAHPKTLRKNSDGEYEVPQIYDIAGGAMWGNKCDNILYYHRPNFFSDPKDTTAIFGSKKIKKQKLVGVPGETTLDFDRKKNRFTESGRSPFESKPVQQDESRGINHFPAEDPGFLMASFEDTPF